MRAIALVAFLALLSVTARAQSPQPAASGLPTYESFRLVRGRYIFDPDRHGMRGEPGTAVVSASRAGGALPNYITLTGAMVTAGRKLAFFSGARPEYNRVLSPQGKVADFTVTDIAPGQVQLQLGGKPIVVSVGENLPLAGSSAAGVPGLQPAPDPAASQSSSSPLGASTVPSGPATSGPPPPAPVGLEEMQRRMMERRQKELGK